jgi:hypothetical protein
MATIRTTTLLSFLILLFSVCSSALCAEPLDDREPPLLMYLEADGARITVELGKPFALDSLSGKKTATLRAESYRVFPYGGISFRYPAGYSFEAKQQSGVTVWTLEGADVVIIVQRYVRNAEHLSIRTAVVDNLVQSYAGPKTRQLDTTLKVKGTVLKGRRIEFVLANTLLHQDIFSFRAGADSVVFIIQDTPQPGGTPSAARVDCDKMLGESLQLPAK